jgi:23S rRNA (uridine2552-2'-O)-methyltransferase
MIGGAGGRNSRRMRSLARADRVSCRHAALPRQLNVPRSKSSARWLKEHFSDPFVKRAQAEGWRSRAVFKLDELLQRDHLLKPGMSVVDLGAAPGGWSQMVRERLRTRASDNGRVIALDILPMQGIAGVEVIEGDFRETAVLERLEALLNGTRVDLVLSDMAPNISGVESVDQARAMELAELAADFATTHLKPGGAFLTKLFQGRGFDDYLRNLRADYDRVSIRKPKASRARSAEVYALASGHRGSPAGRAR